MIITLTVRRGGPAGAWRAPPDPVTHHCMLPQHMPDGAPQGLIFRCSICDAEWTWRWVPPKKPSNA